MLVAVNDLQGHDVIRRPTGTQPHQSPQQRKPPHPIHPAWLLVAPGVLQVPRGLWGHQEPTVPQEPKVVRVLGFPDPVEDRELL